MESKGLDTGDKVLAKGVAAHSSASDAKPRGPIIRDGRREPRLKIEGAQKHFAHSPPKQGAE
jgi:hypothetical protein